MSFTESEKGGVAVVEHALAPSRPLTHKTARRLAGALLLAAHGRPAPLPVPQNVAEETVQNVRRHLWSRVREVFLADLRRMGAVAKPMPSFSVPGGPNRAWVAVAGRRLRHFYQRKGQSAGRATASALSLIAHLREAFGQPEEIDCEEFAALDYALAKSQSLRRKS